MRISNDDEPWVNEQIKILDRKRKREFYKNQKSEKWLILNSKFLQAVKNAKESYKINIVDDLKKSNPSKWYSKLKRMSGNSTEGSTDIFVEEICDLTNQAQAEKIAEFFASTRNSYEPVKNAHFSDILGKNQNFDQSENFVTPEDVDSIISKLNK